MRPFEWWDLVDLANLLMLAGVGRSMGRWVPAWRRFIPCAPAAVSVLFLRSGDGLAPLAFQLLALGSFAWNYVTFHINARAEMKRLDAELREARQKVEDDIQKLEQQLQAARDARPEVRP